MGKVYLWVKHSFLLISKLLEPQPVYFFRTSVHKNEREREKTTMRTGPAVVDNQDTMTAGPRGPALLQDVWFLEKLTYLDREVIPERRMHAKGWALTAHLLKFPMTKRA